MAAGLIGTGILSLGALGLTASGTQAAETIKSNVEAATGITLSQDGPPPPPEAPRAPPAPHATPTPGAAPVAPDAPEAPHRIVRVITTDGEHGDHKGERRVVIVDGGRVDIDGARVHIVGDGITIPSEADILAMTPDVQSGHCKAGDPGQMVVETPAKPGQRGRVVICVNRIERVASNARDTSMHTALAGLRHARMTIEADETLSPDQKREALKGIDSAIRELEQNQKD